jgi:hypothetical protein
MKTCNIVPASQLYFVIEMSAMDKSPLSKIGPLEFPNMGDMIRKVTKHMAAKR